MMLSARAIHWAARSPRESSRGERKLAQGLVATALVETSVESPNLRARVLIRNCGQLLRGRFMTLSKSGRAGRFDLCKFKLHICREILCLSDASTQIASAGAWARFLLVTGRLRCIEPGCVTACDAPKLRACIIKIRPRFTRSFSRWPSYAEPAGSAASLEIRLLSKFQQDSTQLDLRFGRFEALRIRGRILFQQLARFEQRAERIAGSAARRDSD